MSNVEDGRIEEAVAARATQWFVRHREGDLGPHEQREFMQWLRASPRHVSAYLDMVGLASQLPDAVVGVNVDVDSLARKVAQSPRAAEEALFVQPAVRGQVRTRRQVFAAAAVLLIAVAAGGYIGLTQWTSDRTIVVPAGQQRVVTLPDGSIAHVNSGTRVVLRYSANRRLIELPDGQALFDVKHDARRPFIVRSGSTDVVALGTQFDVQHRADEIRVTVVEGRIEIIGADIGREAALRLGAGEQVRVGGDGPAPSAVRVDALAATAWSRKEVAFVGERLEDVAAQFNRYAGANIAIEEPELRDYRISGVFQAYDLDSFVAYLRQFEGIAVERDGDTVRVRQRP